VDILDSLNKPFFALAPMEGVTDTVFRQIVGRCGKPDIFFTEFTSVEGLFSKGNKEVQRRLRFTQGERPIFAQIWGTTPEMYYRGAKKLAGIGFDGIDINMGCPVRKIVKHGACSALINNTQLAKEIYLATKEGAGDLPVSIKTRIGYEKICTDEWLGFLLELNPRLITVHGRISKEMSKNPCNWDEIGKVVLLKNSISPTTLIVGNGDVVTKEQGLGYVKRYGLDGIMIGRAAVNNPWIFSLDCVEPTEDDRKKVLKDHFDLYIETWGEDKGIDSMKKFVKGYISNFDGAADFRREVYKDFSKILSIN